MNQNENQSVAELRAQLKREERELTAHIYEAVQKIGLDPAQFQDQSGSCEQIDSQQQPQPATEPPREALAQNTNPQQNRDDPATTRNTSAETPAEPAESQPARRSPYGPAVGPLGYLNTLPPETQDYVRQIAKEYSFTAGAEILSKPAPEGLGCPITRDALWRFYRRDHRTTENERMERIAQQVQAYLDKADASDEEFTIAAVRMIRARLLESSAQVSTLETIHAVHKMLDQLRRTDIADRKTKK